MKAIVEQLDNLNVDNPGFTCTDDGKSGACISTDTKYRYTLSRVWDNEMPTMVWVMLNPSTADHSVDDQTIRKCCGFARRHGCGSIVVVNCFAYRATDPKELVKAQDPIGPLNTDFIRATLRVAFQRGWIVVAGWGRFPSRKVEALADPTIKEVQKMQVESFGTTKEGYPRHPCMLGYDTQRSPWPTRTS